MKLHIRIALVCGWCASLIPGGGALGGPVDPEFVEEVIDDSRAGDCKMLGDIDGDGRVDVVVAGAPGEGLVWYAWPGWERTLIAQPVTEFSTDGALADIDGDGDLDVVVPDGPYGDNLLVFLNPRPRGNPATGTAWERVVIGAAGDWVKDVEVADFNADGRLDVACRTAANVYIFFQTAGGGWTRVTVDSGLSGEGMASGDLDGDGDVDLVLPGWWLRNPEPEGDAASAAWTSHTIDSSLYNEAKVLVADLDGDGELEVAFSNSEGTGPLRWYDPAGASPTGSWLRRTVIESIQRCHTLQAADMDRDGNLDLVIAQMHTSQEQQVAICYNTGGAVSWRVEVIGTGGLHNGVVGDIDGDGDLDLIGSNWTGNPPVRLWRNLLDACAADFDRSGVVNSADVSAFLGAWLADTYSGGISTDFDNSGRVNSADISAFLSLWLSGTGGCS